MWNVQRITAETFVAKVECHSVIASTNDTAKQRAADAGCPLPLLVLADRQTAGRGRQSNRWWSDAGSLTFSVVVGAGQSRDNRSTPGLESLSAAIAVVEAVAPALPGRDLGICWPNDVIVSGRKLAGILVEVLGNRRQVIGIGVNVNNHLQLAPDDVRGRAATLVELTGSPHDMTALLIAVLQRLEHWLTPACSAEQVVARADALCLQRGQMLSMRCGAEAISGRCLGIGPAGELLLETAQTLRRITSGTVVS